MAILSRPNYINESVKAVRELVKDGVLKPDGKYNHRAVYACWLAPQIVKGKTELENPNLDWKSIWKRYNKLPPDQKETVFLFNHRLPQSRVRMNRLDLDDSPVCGFCGEERETDLHVVIIFSRRGNLIEWLKRRVRGAGCLEPPENFIRGHFGATERADELLAVVAAYIHTIWRARLRGEVPAVEEIAGSIRARRMENEDPFHPP